MTKPTHILVATDLSESSENAVDTAALHARAFGAKVTLVHAFDPSPYVPPVAVPGPTDLLESAAKEVSRSVGEALEAEAKRALEGLEVETAVLRHHAAGVAIVDHAKDVGADLIIVGSHGRTGLARVFLGSVAERVVRHAPCAVLVVRQE